MTKLLDVPTEHVIHYDQSPGLEHLWEMHLQGYTLYVGGEQVHMPDPMGMLGMIDAEYHHNDFTASLKKQGPPFTWKQVRALCNHFHFMQTRSLSYYPSEEPFWSWI